MKKEITLTIEDITRISQFDFYIPRVRGYHHEFISANFPGWSWEDFFPKMLNAKFVKLHEEHGSEFDCTRLSMGFCIDQNIKSVLVTNSGVKTKVIPNY